MFPEIFVRTTDTVLRFSQYLSFLFQNIMREVRRKLDMNFIDFRLH